MGHIAVFGLAALLIPAGVNYSLGHRQTVTRMGERMAIFSAALSMPESGLDLLRERFRSELLPPQEHPQLEPTLPQAAPHQPVAPIQPGELPPSDTPQQPMPRIPERYAAPVVSENFAGRAGGKLIEVGQGFLRNETKYDNDKIAEMLRTPPKLVFEREDDPQVLILHTHATESFERFDREIYDTRNTWRSTDNSNNMVAVGDAMTQVLQQNGINVIHDTTQHDYPSYNGSYERAAKTILEYLEEYPSIKVVLDLHRDAMEREGQTIVKPVVTVEGKQAAQVMIIAGCDDGSKNMPNWAENMRFAAGLQDYVERDYPQLTRPVYLCYRKYNMDKTTGSLLLEFGSNANTLEEAVHSATMVGQALSNYIKDHTE